MTWRFELKYKCCSLLLTLNSRKVADCNGLCTLSCLFVAETSVLHSHTGTVWERVEWCSFEAEHRNKTRENEGNLACFVGNLVALWQSNVDCSWRESVRDNDGLKRMLLVGEFVVENGDIEIVLRSGVDGWIVLISG